MQVFRVIDLIDRTFDIIEQICWQIDAKEWDPSMNESMNRGNSISIGSSWDINGKELPN